MPTESALDRVRKEVLSATKGHSVDVWLYGSWARGDAGRTSDIDVAIDPHGPFSRVQVSRIRDRLHELPVAYQVDLVDLRDAGEEFRRKVQNGGIRWNL